MMDSLDIIASCADEYSKLNEFIKYVVEWPPFGK